MYEVELLLYMEYLGFDNTGEQREECGRATVYIKYDDELENDGYIYSIIYH